MIKEDHSGHRQRIFQRMDRDLPDHEVLEAMLFPMMPRRNTNDLAHRLLERFGSIYEVCAAPLEELKQVDGIGNSIAQGLRCYGVLLEKQLERIARGYEGKFSAWKFAEHIRKNRIEEEIELLELYLLDKEGKVFFRYRFTSQEEETVVLPTHTLARILVQDNPYGVVLVHNHPNGFTTPSANDDKATLGVQTICNRHGVRLCDHIVYGDNHVYSYVLERRINKANGKPYIRRETMVMTEE